MPHTPIETTVIGSYPFPGWLELCSARTSEMGPDDVEEAARDATLVAVMDQEEGVSTSFCSKAEGANTFGEVKTGFFRSTRMPVSESTASSRSTGTTATARCSSTTC